MAGLAYRKEKAMPPASPKGAAALYRRTRAESIADSTFIRPHIEANTVFDFDAPSISAACAGWAFERMIEHHLYWGTGWSALGRCWRTLPKGRRISSMLFRHLRENFAKMRNSALARE